MCDDIASTVAALRAKGVEICGEPQASGFGVMVTIVLPGGVDVLVYEPRHITAI